MPFYSLHSQGVDICCIKKNIQAAIDPLDYCNCQEKEDMMVRISCFPYEMASLPHVSMIAKLDHPGDSERGRRQNQIGFFHASACPWGAGRRRQSDKTGQLGDTRT